MATGLEAIAVSERFSSMKGIPKILGAIDGTHIRIEKPLDRAQDYCNRKKFFSITLQAVADADMRFTNVYCGETPVPFMMLVFSEDLSYFMKHL